MRFVLQKSGSVKKVRDIYATAIDYDPKSDQAQLFFKKVQNKMLWATTHRTAAELIVERANPELPNMGLTSWKGSRVRKPDVTIWLRIVRKM